MTHLFGASAAKPRQKPAMRGELQQEPVQSENGLERAARAIIAEAKDALTAADLPDGERVHALRCAFKRWRALLRLLRRPVGEPAEAMRVEARELMRQLTAARDQQSALDALEDLAKGDVALSPASLKTMRARLSGLRNAAEAAAMTSTLEERIGAYLSEAANALDGWALPQISFEVVADALTATYRRARRLVPEDWTGADADHLHELRRRVVEHRHQMELIEPLWPRFAKMWGEEAQRLRHQLGACQDLAVLSACIAPHEPLAPWRSRITRAIGARREVHLRSASRLAGRLFAEKPNAFRKRTGALWEARKQSTDV
jgi:CHAD domain-containing protein